MKAKPPVHGRLVHLLASVFLLALGLPSGCTPDIPPSDLSGRIPVVRVLLLSSQKSVTLSAYQTPMILLGNRTQPRPLEFPDGAAPLSLTPAGWVLGGHSIGSGELQFLPARDGTVLVNGHAYRGRYRFVPKPDGTFQVINDVDLEGYLKGVVAAEMFHNWLLEAYKAQAVASRTYALYELKTTGRATLYDLDSDQSSQVYGGLSAETDKSRQAVDTTAGEVVAYGPPNHERIFKAYFSSCCGGIGQSAADAFGDTPIAPLEAQSNGVTCSRSTRYYWGPVIVSKAELTNRLRHFGQLHNRPERTMAALLRLDIYAVNSLGRPVKFAVTDITGRRYFYSGEDMRRAVNIDATPKGKLPSSMFQVDSTGPQIRFYNGRGFGHGVGMCQWCAESRAEGGEDYRTILAMAYPHAVIVSAYNPRR